MWARRPEADRWSVAECLVHLNETSEAYIPTLKGAIAQGGAPRPPGRPIRRDLPGWLLCRMLEPPARFHFKATGRFVPSLEVSERSQVLADFDRLQKTLLHLIKEGADLDLTRIRITSPFDGRLKYSVYSAFRILPVHQRRHLWQAERVLIAIQDE